MCGIFGYYARSTSDFDPAEYIDLTNSLYHRGPDAGGYWSEAPFFLGHRRLAILDLEHGDQPMADPSKRFVISYNGEIYNYIEVRKKLEKSGIRFTTNTDTEVVLKAYLYWGVECLKQFTGMFAIAIVDRLAGSLFLARDRIGEKPLFLLKDPNRIAFASELRALAPLCKSPLVNHRALQQYLCMNYLPADNTLLENIVRVKPGTYHLYTKTRDIISSYWDPKDHLNNFEYMDEANALEKLQSNIDQSLNITLRSDVPVALFLSGGIDSSLVAESAVRQGRIKEAYCLDFAESSFSEWGLANKIANKLHLKLNRVVLTDEVFDDFHKIASHCDDPLADSSALAVWSLAKAASQDYKVIISGDGGDELFAGYLTYQASILHQAYIKKLPNFIRSFLARMAFMIKPSERRKVSTGYKLLRFLRSADLPTEHAHLTWNGSWLPKDLNRLLTIPTDANILAHIQSSNVREQTTLLDYLMYTDLCHYLPNDIMNKVDRMTMAHSLESRAPLLNHELVEFALALPSDLKMTKNSQSKKLLRKLNLSLYGQEIAGAKKQGFSVPIHRWLRGKGREYLEYYLSDNLLSEMSFMNKDAIIRAKQSHLKQKSLLGFELWGLMIFGHWYENRILRNAISISSKQKLQQLILPKYTELV